MNSSRRWIRAIATIVAAAGIYAGTMSILHWDGPRLNGSPSMPLGVYWLRGGVFPRERGAIVFACPNQAATQYLHRWKADETSGGSCSNGLPSLVKYAAALPGDVVQLSARGVRVNGGSLLYGSRPQRFARDKIGRLHEIPHVPYGTYRIPNGEVWLYTPEWFSFDSRYYGPARIIGIGYPLWTYASRVRAGT